MNNFEDNRNVYIKRVIGLPGDVIKYQLVDNIIMVFINNNPEKELIKNKYNLIDNNEKYPLLSEYTVKQDEYYVLGDNRKHSFDSRFIGSINLKQIIGKAVLKYWNWPFDYNKLGVLK